VLLAVVEDVDPSEPDAVGGAAAEAVAEVAAAVVAAVVDVVVVAWLPTVAVMVCVAPDVVEDVLGLVVLVVGRVVLVVGRVVLELLVVLLA
jgi:hypothetical protein